jgi:DNA repair protein RadC
MALQQLLQSDSCYQIPIIRLTLVREGTNSQAFSINSPTDIARFLEPLRTAAEEHFVSVHLNVKSEVIGLHEISHGTLSSSLVHPREVYKAALLANSHAIIVCHNHPSGSRIEPSPEDLETTKQLLRAGRLLGVDLVDHLIVGPGEPKNNYYSFREQYPIFWDAP